MVSEIRSICAIVGGAGLALVPPKRPSVALHRLLRLSVTAALVNLAVLGVSGFGQDSGGWLAMNHALAGHLMLPLVGTAAGLWLGTSVARIGWRPFQALPRLLFLLVLSFFCLSNTWTGYLGPSRIDPSVDPETNLRFAVLHRWAVPLLIGTMLLLWLRRLAAGITGQEPKAPPIPQEASRWAEGPNENHLQTAG